MKSPIKPGFSYRYDTPVFVYAIECGEHIKIGIASDPSIRLRGMEVGCPYPMTLLARRQFPTREIAGFIEKSIHYRLEAQKHRGEWFSKAPTSPVDELLRQYEAARPLYNLPAVETLLDEQTDPIGGFTFADLQDQWRVMADTAGSTKVHG